MRKTLGKDYKRSNQRIKSKAAPRSRSASPIKWLFAGVALGIALIVGVPHLPFSKMGDHLQSLANSTASTKKEEANKKKLPAAKKLAVKKTENDKKAAQPSFDFYTMLPEMKVDIPAKETRTAAAKSETTKPNIPAPSATNNIVVAQAPIPPLKKSLLVSPKHYALQIAVFKNLSDADAMKSELAVHGLPVRLETMTTEAGEVMHRVKMGSYKNKELAEQNKQRLTAMNFKNIVIISDY